MHTEPKTTAPPPFSRRLGRRRLWWSFLTALFLMTGLLVTTPLLLKWYVEKMLAARGAVEAKIENIDFNPFTAVLRLEALRTLPGLEDEGLRIAETVIKYRWLPLWKQRLDLQSLTVKDVTIEVERRRDGSLLVGRLPLPGVKKKEQEGEPWQLGIGKLRLTNVRINYHAPDLELPILVQQAEIAGLQGWQPGKAGSIALRMTINDQPLTFSGEATPFAALPALTGKIKLDGFRLAMLSPLLQSLGLTALHGSLSLDSTIALQLGADKSLTASSKGELAVSGFAMHGPENQRVAAASLVWQGPLHLRQQPGRFEIGTGREFHRQFSAPADPTEGGSLRLRGFELQSTAWSVRDLELTWQGPFSYQGGAAGAAAGLALQGELQGTVAEWQLALRTGHLAGGLRTGLKLRIEESAPGGMSINSSGTLELEDLQGKIADLGFTQQQLGWDGALAADLAPDRLEVSGEGQLAAARTGASFGSINYQLSQERMAVNGSFTMVSRRDSPLDLRIAADGEGAGLRLTANEQQQTIAGLEAYLLNGGSFSLTDGPRLRSLRLSGLNLLARQQGQGQDRPEPEFIASLQQAIFHAPALRLENPRRLTSQAVEMQGLRVRLERDQAGKLEVLTAVKEVAANLNRRESEAGEKKTAPEAPFTFKIDRLELKGDNRLSFHDRSVSPDFTAVLAPFTLSLKDLGNTGQHARVELAGEIGDYGELAVNGSMRPFGATIDMEMQAAIQEYDLTLLTPYLRQHLGYTVDSGQLQAELNWQVAADRLTGYCRLTLSKPELTRIEAEATAEATGNLKLPLDRGLNLLQDRRQNINLDIPLSGDINDPQFHFGKVFWSGFGNALERSVRSYFGTIGIAALTGVTLPIGALWVAGQLYSKITALRFAPLHYEPLHSGIPPGQQPRLRKLTELLNDRPSVELVICGTAALTDLQALRQVRDKGREPTAAGQPPDEAELKALHSLADRRAQSVKEYLFQAGIPSDRLITCRPEFTADPESQPRVELGI